MFIKTNLLLFSIIIDYAWSIPPNDKALFPDGGPELRRKQQRPCIGRSNEPEGRTFFDWSYQQVNVDYNTNYNINCGENGAGNKPSAIGQGGGLGGLLVNHFQSHLQEGGPLMNLLQSQIPQGGGSRPPLQGVQGNRPGGALLGLVQSQAQGIATNVQNSGFFNDIGSGQIINSLGSFLPQGDFFNGQGISSLFQNGLFSNIFNSPNGISSSPNVPSRPPAVSVPQNPVTPSSGGSTTDPDDIIYNDERPVHEDHDPVFPDTYNRPTGIRPRPVPTQQYNRPRPQVYNNYRNFQGESRSNSIRFE